MAITLKQNKVKKKKKLEKENVKNTIGTERKSKVIQEKQDPNRVSL